MPFLGCKRWGMIGGSDYVLFDLYNYWFDCCIKPEALLTYFCYNQFRTKWKIKKYGSLQVPRKA
jgi:hypothetical protein